MLRLGVLARAAASVALGGLCTPLWPFLTVFSALAHPLLPSSRLVPHVVQRCSSHLLRHVAAAVAASKALAFAAPAQFRTILLWRRFMPIYLAYMWTDTSNKFRSPQAQHQAWERRHEWGGIRVYAMVLELSGYCVKLSQVLATKTEFMPQQWTQRLQQLFDSMPPHPWPGVKASIETHLAACPLARTGSACSPAQTTPAPVVEAATCGSQASCPVPAGRANGAAGNGHSRRNHDTLSAVPVSSAADEGTTALVDGGDVAAIGAQALLLLLSHAQSWQAPAAATNGAAAQQLPAAAEQAPAAATKGAAAELQQAPAATSTGGATSRAGAAEQHVPVPQGSPRLPARRQGKGLRLRQAASAAACGSQQPAVAGGAAGAAGADLAGPDRSPSTSAAGGLAPQGTHQASVCGGAAEPRGHTSTTAIPGAPCCSSSSSSSSSSGSSATATSTSSVPGAATTLAAVIDGSTCTAAAGKQALGATGGQALGATGGQALGATGGQALGATGGQALGATGGQERWDAGHSAGSRLVGSNLPALMRQFFDWVESEALASASIAQVHRGRLSQHVMERVDSYWREHPEVVLKVQHKKMQRLMTVDLANAGRLASFIRGVLPFDPLPVVMELQAAVPREFDFVREAQLTTAIRERLEEAGLAPAGVVVPRVLHDLSSPCLLVLEQMEGVPFTAVLSQVAAGDTRLLPAAQEAVRKLVYAHGHMILQEGVFHADPHPGNLLLQAATTRCVLLDFGQCKALTVKQQLQLCRLVAALEAGAPLPIALAMLGLGLTFGAPKSGPSSSAATSSSLGAPPASASSLPHSTGASRGMPAEGPAASMPGGLHGALDLEAGGLNGALNLEAGGLDGALNLEAVAAVAYVMFDTRSMDEARLSPFKDNPVLKQAPITALPPFIWMFLRSVMLLRGLCHALHMDIRSAEMWGPLACATLADPAAAHRAWLPRMQFL